MTINAAERAVEMPPLTAKARGQYSQAAADEAARVTVERDNAHEEPVDILSAVLERPNMQRAYARVMRNKGASGVDGLTVVELKDYLSTHWSMH